MGFVLEKKKSMFRDNKLFAKYRSILVPKWSEVNKHYIRMRDVKLLDACNKKTKKITRLCTTLYLPNRFRFC